MTSGTTGEPQPNVTDPALTATVTSTTVTPTTTALEWSVVEAPMAAYQGLAIAFIEATTNRPSVWDLGTGRVAQLTPGPASQVAPLGTRGVMVKTDDAIHVYERGSMRELFTLPTDDEKERTGLTTSADGATLWEVDDKRTRFRELTWQGQPTGRTIRPPDQHRYAMERLWIGSGLLLVGPDEIYHADGTVTSSPFTPDQYVGGGPASAVWLECADGSCDAVVRRFSEPPRETRIPLKLTEPSSTVRGFTSPDGDSLVLYELCYPIGTCYSLVTAARPDPVSIGAQGPSPSTFSWGADGDWLLESRVVHHVFGPPGELTVPPVPRRLEWNGWNLTSVATGETVPLIPQTIKPLDYGFLLP
ncbi:MAG: hypothetical protein ACKV2O_02590 [Acidimicrobiales bacterium]